VDDAGIADRTVIVFISDNGGNMYNKIEAPVPDWLSPSISIHSGDWKLIRIFHGGDNGVHDYRLYNLAEDIGEKNNLVAEQPDRLKTLDTMIENYLKEAKTVVPQPNPNFDPKLYKPERIGGHCDIAVR
jgi:arylsulfatase A-like enzyme